MKSLNIKLGARTSKMAQAVALHAKELIETKNPTTHVETHFFSSAGCLHAGDLKELGGKGAFVNDLEERLVRKEIDCAIHALKDIPGDRPMNPELELFCFLPRSNPRDVLIMHPQKANLSEGTGTGYVLATSSPRRQAVLKNLYPGVTVVPLRGNVDTRMKKLLAGEFDGMVLSYAGLTYLELTQYANHVFTPEQMLPAIGQGVLCIQIRKEDRERYGFLKSINHIETETAVHAEREMLQLLHGNCFSAIGGYCTVSPQGLRLRGLVASLDGKHMITTEQSCSELSQAALLGKKAAEDLIKQGADKIIRTV